MIAKDGISKEFLVQEFFEISHTYVSFVIYIIQWLMPVVQIEKQQLESRKHHSLNDFEIFART